MSSDEPRWLDDRQQKAWRSLVAVVTRLPAALDTQMQRDADLTHFEYFVLAVLSEAPGRRLQLSALAEDANASLSRLSHVVTRLAKRGWVCVKQSHTAEGRMPSSPTTATPRSSKPLPHMSTRYGDSCSTVSTTNR